VWLTLINIISVVVSIGELLAHVYNSHSILAKLNVRN
jgi:hypothetical protein